MPDKPPTFTEAEARLLNYEVTLWLDNGVRQKRTKFKIEVQPDTDISEAAISMMPSWVVDEGWEVEDSKYKKV